MKNEQICVFVIGGWPVNGCEDKAKRRIEKEYGAAESIKYWTVNAATKSTESIDNIFEKANNSLNNAVESVDNVGNKAEQYVDNVSNAAREKIEKAKREVEEKIQKVRDTFEKFTKDFDDAFGFLLPKNIVGNAVQNMSDTAYSNNMEGLGELTGEVANFVKNFNIGKVVSAIGGIVIGAGTATVVMDLLPSVDVDRMLRSIMSGVETKMIDKMAQLQYNKYYGSEPDLLEVPDVPWMLSKDDLEKYNADAYNKYLEEYSEQNDKIRSELLEKMNNVKSVSDLMAVTKENREKMKENKSAIKAMRKVRRGAIKAKQIEKYKGFLSIELEYLKKDCLNMKNSIKNEWDSMIAQYKNAIAEIKSFFTSDGSGGSEIVDRCCDRINDDATQIVELCKSIGMELANAVIKVPVPYAIGFCFDMPVQKILSFINELQIIITFLKNLIRLGLDIIAQITIIIKLIFNGLKDLADLLKKLKELIGVDKILNLIDALVALFTPKLADSKIMIENAINPIYYNETEDYENRVTELENALKGDIEKYGVDISKFRSTDDMYARKHETYGGYSESVDKVEGWLEALEEKGDNEIVAYRSPILNESGDDFAGWIYYHPYAYNFMYRNWSAGYKRRKNRLIKKASKKNKVQNGKPVGGVAQLKADKTFGYTSKGRYKVNSVTGFDAYYWYTKWTTDPTDCVPDFSNVEMIYDENGNLVVNNNFKSNVVSPIQTTSNGSLVQLDDGRRVFVEGEIVKSGDYVNVEGQKYRVK